MPSSLSLYELKSNIFFSLKVFNLSNSFITSEKNILQLLYLAPLPIYPGTIKFSKNIWSYFILFLLRSSLKLLSLISCEINLSFALFIKASYDFNFSTFVANSTCFDKKVLLLFSKVSESSSIFFEFISDLNCKFFIFSIRYESRSLK